MVVLSLLLVGLGNPGEKYARHRHNVGFMAVDAIADVNGFSARRTKFQGDIRDGFLDAPSGRLKSYVLKPLTFMNLSGQSVSEAMRFFKLEPKDVVVFHDELDLAAGKIKVKTGGGHAGHNGLRSIDEHIGPDFRRVRIGIGHPGDKARVTGHVLGDFAKADQEWLPAVLAALACAAPMLAVDDARYATAVAQRLLPPKPKKEAPPEPGIEIKRAADDAPDANPAPVNPFAEALHKIFKRKD